MSHIQSESVIEKIIAHYGEYLRNENDNLLLIDPNDQKVIGFHYGETHLGTAMIIWGNITKNSKMAENGRRIIKGFLAHIAEYRKQPDYHWDFNNFVLCILVNYLEGKLKSVKDNLRCCNFGAERTFCEELRNFLITQQDSNNPTINWLPMRMYVNYCKYQWTGNAKYSVLLDDLAKHVKDAQYTDGFYEDLLPKGKSFNFQYHLYTTAVLHFLETQGIMKVENNKAVHQARAVVDPCGDVNYLGRGLNQIFAWGPALYLYQSVNADKELEKAWSYFNSRIKIAIDNDNLILNEMPGVQKNWWWDYHYASVYFAHLLFWLVIAQISKKTEEKFIDCKIKEKDSGVNFIDTNYYKVCIFEGRKHYLAEKGPLLVNICRKDGCYIFKGAFGPFPGAFGNNYSIPSQTIHNYFGPVQEKIISGYLIENALICKSIDVKEVHDNLIIKLELAKKYKHIRLNLPLLCDISRVVISCDGHSNLLMNNSGTVVGAYGMTNLYVSNYVDASWFEIKIRE